MAYIYLGLSFLGAIGPFSVLGQFLIKYGLNYQEFLNLLKVNPVSQFAGLNMALTTIVAVLFILSEGRRLKLKGVWLPFLATLGAGVACGLPLFLYLRQISVDSAKTIDNNQIDE